jgi:uncharacterized protein (TIGR02452 family)
MTKEKLIEVYQDTESICANIPIPQSDKMGILIFGATDKLDCKITVEPMDTISALEKYAPLGKTAVLNMASSIKKGGGVAKGAMAQEECLFRCSNLFTIPDEYYPLDIDEFIYTHSATFVKSAKFTPISIKADVITVAAPNINKENKYYNPKDFEKFTYEEQINFKLMQMFVSAHCYRCKNIILGAWGCGVFKNDPITIANAFKNALEHNNNLFENIVFAVINDRNSVANNYQIFYDAFK